MPPIPPPIRLKITCEGEPWSVCVRDVATNALIHNVSAIAWSFNAGTDTATATITLELIPVDFVVDNPQFSWIADEGKTIVGNWALNPSTPRA